MDGDNHIMVFKQLRTNKPAEAKVKCTLVPLPHKADVDQSLYETSSAKEKVLRGTFLSVQAAQKLMIPVARYTPPMKRCRLSSRGVVSG